MSRYNAGYLVCSKLEGPSGSVEKSLKVSKIDNYFTSATVAVDHVLLNG